MVVKTRTIVNPQPQPTKGTKMATKQPQIDEWQARDAADTLARAEAIKANKPLHAAAKTSAQASIDKLQTVV